MTNDATQVIQKTISIRSDFSEFTIVENTMTSPWFTTTDLGANSDDHVYIEH